MHFLPKNLECFCSWCFGKRVERFLNLCTHKPSNVPPLVWISQIVEVIAWKQHKRETKGSVWGSFPAPWFVPCLSAFPHDSKFIGVTNHLQAGYPMLLASGLPWALGTVQAGLVGWGVKGEGGQQVPLCHCLLLCHPLDPWGLRCSGPYWALGCSLLGFFQVCPLWAQAPCPELHPPPSNVTMLCWLKNLLLYESWQQVENYLDAVVASNIPPPVPQGSPCIMEEEVSQTKLRCSNHPVYGINWKHTMRSNEKLMGLWTHAGLGN